MVDGGSILPELPGCGDTSHGEQRGEETRALRAAAARMIVDNSSQDCQVCVGIPGTPRPMDCGQNCTKLRRAVTLDTHI